MLQIFIPKDMVDQCVYLSRTWGCAYTKNLDVGNDSYDTTLGYQAKIQPVLEAIQSGKIPQGKLTKEVLEQLQARILLGKDIILNPKSGVKIFREVNLPKEKLAWYRSHVQKIVRRVAIDWITRLTENKLSPEVIKRIEGTPLETLLRDKDQAQKLLYELKKQAVLIDMPRARL